MDGYVIVLKHDEPDQPDNYWTGTAATTDLENMAFFNDIIAARQAAGTLQTQYFDRTVQITKAVKGIRLVDPVTNNVATSSQSANTTV